MINVRALANSATRGVNPNRMVTLEVNQGYTVNEYGEQVPQFYSAEVEAQIQSLTSEEKQNLDLVNKEGELISIYVFGAVGGIRRWLQKGSSKFIFNAYGEDEPAEWVVNKVLETYPNWTRVLAWRQS